MEKLKRIVTEQDLRHIPVTYQGNSYQPVLHRQAIETVKEYLYKHNFTISSENYLAASNGQRVIARYGIKYNEEFDYMIGFANSHDGSIAFKYVAGSILRVCSNGSIWGSEDTYKRKHIGSADIDIISTLETKINLLEQTMQINERNTKRMKEIEVSKETISKLIGEAFLYEELIRVNQLSIIKKEVQNPSFDYNSPNSLFELYSHFTYAIKESIPTEWVQNHVEISDYFINSAGVLEKKGQIEAPKLLLSEQLVEMI